MNFWGYENWTAEQKAVIHKGSCGHCKEGRGCHQNILGEKNGRWLGPYSTLADAQSAANATKRSVRRHLCV